MGLHRGGVFLKVSVILVTARCGGLDMLWHSMRRQTFPREDFEVVMVDGFYEQRRVRAIKPFLEAFQFKHLPLPALEIYANSSGWNAGLRAARGELVLFLVDFCWPPPAWLEQHWRFYQNNPGVTMSGYVDRYPYPAIDKHKIWPDYWSIFEDEFDERRAELWFAREPMYRERKGGMAGPLIERAGVHEMPGPLVYMLNDSIPMEVLKRLNGWDQMYDGGYGSNDIDLACRANMAGHKFGLSPESVIRKLGDKSVAHMLPAMRTKFIRPPEANFQLFRERMAAVAEGREPLEVPAGRGAWA